MTLTHVFTPELINLPNHPVSAIDIVYNSILCNN